MNVLFEMKQKCLICIYSISTAFLKIEEKFGDKLTVVVEHATAPEDDNHYPHFGWGKPTRALFPWRQGFRHPTRNECMGWFAQILHSYKEQTLYQPGEGNLLLVRPSQSNLIWRLKWAVGQVEGRNLNDENPPKCP